MSARRRTISTSAAAYPYDQAWIDAVVAWCEREGRGAQARLAKAAGIAEGTLSQLLHGPPNRASVAVPAINKMIGLPPPQLASGSVDADDVGAQVNATIAALDDEDAETFRQMIESAIRHARRASDRSRNRRS